MNSLSKVTVLVTLLTVPFAGFAMDFDVPALESDVVVEATEVATEAAQNVTEQVVEFAKENPGYTAVIVAGAGVALYGLKRLVFGGSNSTEVKEETVNPQVEKKTGGALFAKKTAQPAQQQEKKADAQETTNVKSAGAENNPQDTAKTQKKSGALFTKVAKK